MEKTTLSNIKSLVKKGAATELKRESIELKRRLSKIKYSTGAAGVNGVLFLDEKSGKLYAITERSHILFYYI